MTTILTGNEKTIFDTVNDSNSLHQLDPNGVNEYIITAKDWEDETLYNELQTEGIAPAGTNITREVMCAMWRETSRNTHYWLTQEEVDQLKSDPRILDIQPHPRYLNVRIVSDGATQTAVWSKNLVPDTASGTHVNWGLLESTLGSTISGWGYDATNYRNVTGFVTDQTLNRSDTITLDATGKNVDVIIMDAGPMVVGHPEFAKNADGTGGSRVIEYDWNQHAPTIYNRNVIGTFIAGIAPYANRSVWVPYAIGGLPAYNMLDVNLGTWTLHNFDDTVAAVIVNYVDTERSSFVLDRAVNSSWLNTDRILKLKLTNPNPYNYYTFASVSSHSNHVAGTAAGNRQGWAKDANIYSISYNSPYNATYDDANPWTMNSGLLFDVTSFDFIREFHKNKPINPDTGRKNPTIVNMSWSIVSMVDTIPGATGIKSLSYRGTTKDWTITETDSPFTLVNSSSSVQDQWLVSPKSRIFSCNKKVADFIDGGRGNRGNKIYTTGTTAHNGSKILSIPSNWKQDAGIATLWTQDRYDHLADTAGTVSSQTDWYGTDDVTVQGPCTIRVSDMCIVLDEGNPNNNDVTAQINVTITNTSTSAELYNKSSTGANKFSKGYALCIDDKVILPDNVVYRIRFTHSATETTLPPVNSIYYQTTTWISTYQSAVHVLYEATETAAATVTEIPYVQPDKTGYFGYTFVGDSSNLITYPFSGHREMDIRGDGYVKLTLPFNVTVFEESYSSVYFSNNGVSFGHQDDTLCGLKTPYEIIMSYTDSLFHVTEKYTNGIDPLDTGETYYKAFPNRPTIKFIHGTTGASIFQCYYTTTNLQPNRIFTVYLALTNVRFINAIADDQTIYKANYIVSISFYENDPSRIDIHTGSGDTTNYYNNGNYYARPRTVAWAYNNDNAIWREYGGRDSAVMALRNNYSMYDRGISNGSHSNYLPYQLSTYDADIEDAQKEGIIFVAAAGNDNRLMDSIGGVDYDNYYITPSSTDLSLTPESPVYGCTSKTIYYNRASSPTRIDSKSLGGNYDLKTIVVGATDNTSTGQRAHFSNYGPAVTIWAPGVSIMSSTLASDAIPVLNNGYSKYFRYPQDPRNGSYYLRTMRGTSMASPQVCGVIACALERYPWMTQADALEYITSISRKGYMYNTAATPIALPASVTVQKYGTAGIGGGNNYFLQYKTERPASGNSWPKTNYWLRNTSGQVYPRTSRKRYK